MGTPRTGKSRGRPRYNFFGDRERYAIACIDALLVLGTSETDAFHFAASQIVGVPKEARAVDARRKRGRGFVPSGIRICYDSGTTTIAGKAVTLRRKHKRATSPEEAAWRVTMGRAFLLALRAKDLDRCASEIMELTQLFTPDFMTDVQTEILWGAAQITAAPNVYRTFPNPAKEAWTASARTNRAHLRQR